MPEEKNSSQPISPNRWTIEELKTLSTTSIETLFETLPCPTIEEMSGDYSSAFIGAKGHFISNFIWHLSCNLNITTGKWLGKSFVPESGTAGYGYNTLEKYGMKRKKYPMKTFIGKSAYDGKDVFSLHYRYFYSLAGIVNMSDEVRRLDENRYLGVGHWKMPPGIPMASLWFVLTGPTSPIERGYL
ncbi:hypothetical protein [Alcanivorax sp.]|jgi:hypothetical protein|uniref:hypothetical protein n=1 Tax=Alcanivorax sp. TaxID=1872427 RepID=UPI0032D991B6